MSSNSIYYLNEKNCYEFSFVLYDEDDNRINLAALDTLQCTLYYYNPELGTSDRYHLATINNRYNQDTKNANNVEVTTTGTVTWNIQAEDTVMLNTSEEQELHVALFTWYWSPSKRNSHEFNLYVRKVPYSI